MAELTPQQEALVYAAVVDAYRQWLPAAQAAVLGGYDRYGVAPDPAAITATTPLWRQQVEEIQRTALTTIAEEQYAEEDPDGQFNPGDALLVAAAAATTVFLVAQIGETQAALVNIAAAAATTAAAVEAIRQFLSWAGGPWLNKARQVAETEADRWAQAATLAAARNAQARDGIRRQKIWQTRRDDAVRDTHRRVQGQRRDLYAAFDVDGFPMQYPHDPVAPADLVVNCRCWMRIVKRVS